MEANNWSSTISRRKNFRILVNFNSLGAQRWKIETKESSKCLGMIYIFFLRKKVICRIGNVMTILHSCFIYPSYSFHIKLYKWSPERIMPHKWWAITFFSFWNCCLLLMVNIMCCPYLHQNWRQILFSLLWKYVLSGFLIKVP